MKWCGAHSDATVKNSTNVIVSDAIPLCEITTAVNDQADPTVGWCRGSISLARVGTTEDTPSIAWAIVMMRIDVGGSDPVQVFNPFDAPNLERQDILGMGHIPAPPTIIESTDDRLVDHSSRVVDVNIRVGRKLHRNTNNLFLWIVSQSANVEFQAEATIRTLMKF